MAVGLAASGRRGDVHPRISPADNGLLRGSTTENVSCKAVWQACKVAANWMVLTSASELPAGKLRLPSKMASIG